MSKPLVIFSHGQESGPWGTKISAMAAVARGFGCAVDSIDYRGIDDPTARVDRLLGYCRERPAPKLLAGSSMGGHVAAAAALDTPGVLGLFLLAPAFYMPGFEALTPGAPVVPVSIVHGWGDDVVPVANSIRWAGEHRKTLHIVDGDHRLTANIQSINVLFNDFLHSVSGE